MNAETRFCPHCGSEGDPNDRFCRSCGADLSTQVFATGPAAASTSDKTTRNAVLATVAVIALVLLAGGAFFVGREAAPTQAERDAEELKARQVAAQTASNEATGGREDAGYNAGLKLGRASGKKRGTKAGTKAGGADVAQRQEQAQQQAAAQQAAQQRQQLAEEKERLQNCLDPLAVGDYCPSDEEIEQDITAQTLCGAGKVDEAEAKGIKCE